MDGEAYMSRPPYTSAESGRCRGRRSQRGVAVVAAGLAVAMAAACTTDSGKTTTGRTASTTLNIGFLTAPASPGDPNKGAGNDSIYFDLAYEPLIYRAGNGSLQPGLATSWGYVGSGNTVFELHLRPNVRFSDGSAMTATNVASFIRNFAKTATSAVVVGSVKSVDTVDAHTVRVTFAKPNPIAATVFTQDYLAGDIVGPKGQANPSQLATSTDGAGPYQLDTANTVAGDHYTYVPNQNYWNKSAVHYKTVVVKVLANPNTALAALKTGQVDVLRGDFTTAAAAKKDGLTVSAMPANFQGLALADRAGSIVPALKDMRVRQALNYAVDRAHISQGLLGEYGTPTEQIALPGGDGFYTPNYYSYDPSKAKTLLAEAGYSHGFTLPVLTYPEQGLGTVVQAIAADLQKVGVNVKITSVPQAAFFKQAFTGKWAAFGILFGSLPMQLMGPILAQPSGLFNPFKSTDATVDQLLTRAASAPAATSADLDRQISQRLAQLGWFLPVINAPAFYYSRSTVAGVRQSQVEPYADPVEWHPAS
jgi:ABC-type transport system substrate-binding protein